jgi:hypothetical protein
MIFFLLIHAEAVALGVTQKAIAVFVANKQTATATAVTTSATLGVDAVSLNALFAKQRIAALAPGAAFLASQRITALVATAGVGG